MRRRGGAEWAEGRKRRLGKEQSAESRVQRAECRKRRLGRVQSAGVRMRFMKTLAFHQKSCVSPKAAAFHEVWGGVQCNAAAPARASRASGRFSKSRTLCGASRR